jgi:hypothetical protein
MIEDDSELVRKECVRCLPLDDATIGLFACKTQDISVAVRIETYIQLKNQWQSFQ